MRPGRSRWTGLLQRSATGEENANYIFRLIIEIESGAVHEEGVANLSESHIQLGENNEETRS